MSDGHVDLDALEDGMSREWMTVWIRSHLLEQDDRVPFHKDDFELAEQLFINMWFRAKSDSLVHDALDFGCDTLLGEAWDSLLADKLCRFAPNLLDLAAVIRPESARSRFADIILSPLDFTIPLLEKWLLAAAAYQNQSPELLRKWMLLLQQGIHPVITCSVLSQSPDWDMKWNALLLLFKALSPADRNVLFNSEVKRFLEKQPGCVLDILVSQLELFSSTPGFLDTVNSVSVSLGYASIFR